MLVRRGRAFDSVGEWWFQSPQAGSQDANNVDVLHTLLRMAQDTLEGLATQDLLRPQQITIPSWQVIAPYQNDPVAEGLAPLLISPDAWPCQPSAFAATVEAAVQRHQAGRPFRMPSVIIVDGASTLLDTQGIPHLIPDVLWVEARIPAISVNTRSDVWLPYSLLARPQQELAARNAPRLKAALQAVEARIGAPGTVDIRTDYATYEQDDPYTLRNFFSDIGEDDVQEIMMPPRLERLLNEPNPPAWLFEHEV